MELGAVAPGEHHGVKNRHVGGPVEADDGNERGRLLVDAEHAAGVVDEGGGHLQEGGVGLLRTWDFSSVPNCN